MAVVNEDDVMDLQKYADVMALYRDVGDFLGKRYNTAVIAAEKKFGADKNEDHRNKLIGAISFSAAMNAITHLRIASNVISKEAVIDLVDGFISELSDLKEVLEKGGDDEHKRG